MLEKANTTTNINQPEPLKLTEVHVTLVVLFRQTIGAVLYAFRFHIN